MSKRFNPCLELDRGRLILAGRFYVVSECEAVDFSTVKFKNNCTVKYKADKIHIGCDKTWVETSPEKARLNKKNILSDLLAQQLKIRRFTV